MFPDQNLYSYSFTYTEETEVFTEQGFIYAPSATKAIKKLNDFYGEPDIDEIKITAYDGSLPILLSKELFDQVETEIKNLL